MSVPNRDRLHELQTLRALEGLDTTLQSELERLLQISPDESSADSQESWSLAAAALANSAMNSTRAEHPPLPDQLRRRLEADAQRFLAERQAAASSAPQAAQPTPRPIRTQAPPDQPGQPHQPGQPGQPGQDREGGARPMALLGWVLAAAASALLLLRQPAPLEEGPGPALTLAEQLENLRASSDSVDLNWSTTEDPLNGAATGTVVWNERQQRGFMLFEGLPINQVTKQQYQLWIFDAQRPDTTPVDGGVFDIDSDRVIVPIEAKLEVFEPTLFAITLEESGGVVVSEREHLLLVASVD